MSTVWTAVSGGMLSWYDVKMFIERSSAVSSDALHVIVGFVLWMLVALVSRRPLSASLPWLVLLVLLVFNEAVDLWVEQWPNPAMQYGESAKDLLLTMTLPTLLLAFVRFLPQLFRQPPRGRRRPGARSRRS